LRSRRSRTPRAGNRARPNERSRSMSGNDTLTKASLPAASLRLALEGSIGPDEAARALQDVGQKLGDQVYERLAASLRDDQTTAATGPADLDEAGFWQRLGKIFAELGWGEL